MGLKNISKKAERIKYNGVEVLVEPDATVDVRDFNIHNNEVMAVEDILSNKHRDENGAKIFEHSKTISNMTDAQINAEIERLKQELEFSNTESLAKDKDLESQAVEIEKYKDEAAKDAKKIEKLEKKVETLEEKIKG